jgi:hypothetical protein
LYALLCPCECFGGLLLFALKRRAARPVARANTNAPIAAIHSPSVVNMPRYAFFLIFQIHCAEHNLFPFSCFFFQPKFCARERGSGTFFLRTEWFSHTLSQHISLVLCVFLQFQLCTISSCLAHFRVFQKCVFRVFWG